MEPGERRQRSTTGSYGWEGPGAVAGYLVSKITRLPKGWTREGRTSPCTSQDNLPGNKNEEHDVGLDHTTNKARE